jgi:hypothetical protein
MTYTIIRGDDRKKFDDKGAFEDTVDFLEKQGEDFETETPETDGGPKQAEPVAAETVDTTEESRKLISDPIAYLQGINNEFVNTIKGTPAISKRGFRYIQTELGISTESEVVVTFNDPMGVIVHARAEMPDGRTAEAHGEGYRDENDVSDNEFARYADSRAKNRAISDLTSAGALAESEL